MFGFRMNEYQNDNLIVAWGCRAIVERDGRLDILGNRQSVVGKQSMVDVLIKIVNKYALPAAMEYSKLHHSEQEIIHDVWGSEIQQPMELLMRFADGYCYMRIGIRMPVIKTERWTGYRPKLGETVELSNRGTGNGGEVVTYCEDQYGWQYGFVFDSEKTPPIIAQELFGLRPWYFLTSFAWCEYTMGDKNAEELQCL